MHHIGLLRAQKGILVSRLKRAFWSHGSHVSVCEQVLKRINSEIEARRKAGENLPPPPKTAIAGPEYFGLNQPEVCTMPSFVCVCLHAVLSCAKITM